MVDVLVRVPGPGTSQNCLAATPDAVWLSQRAREGLSEHQRGELVGAGFALRAVPLDEIEKAGGSVRCCIGEIF